MTDLSTRIRRNGASLSAPIAFDIESAAPDVAQALFVQEPELRRAFDALRELIPLAPNNSPDPTTGYYRLPQHHRSLCLTVDEPSPDRWLQSPVLAFKGTELLLSDSADYLSWMQTARIRQEELPISECFPLVMGVAPGTINLYEAAR